MCVCVSVLKKIQLPGPGLRSDKIVELFQAILLSLLLLLFYTLGNHDPEGGLKITKSRKS